MIDLDMKLARRKLMKKYSGISNIRFGKIRRDKTRGVSFYYKGTKGSYSYLTDIG